MNVICYSRVATPDQEGSNNSLEQQKSTLRDYCAMKKYNIVGEYSEVFSGSTFDRPQWNELSEFCRQNKDKVDMIIFTSWDRWSRNLYDALTHINLLKKQGIELYAINSPVGYYDPANKILRSLLLTLPEIEDSE